MLFPAAKLGANVLGVDLHDVMGATPSPAGPIPTPVPKFPHPFVGSLSLWHSPKWPMANVFVNGQPAASVGCKGYASHMPPILPPPVVFTTWLPPAQITPKWYLQNLVTVGLSTVFQLATGVVRGIVDPMITGRGEVPSTWQSVKGTLGGLSWLQLFQSLLPPAVLPIAEGNIAIGSPTVTVNGSPFALVGPMFGSSCTTFPASLAPNASVLGFSNVMVGLTLTDFLLQVFWNGVNNASSVLAGKIVEANKCKLGLEPIDLVSGCNFEDKTDFTLPGPVPLKWSRCYRSLKSDDNPLGYGWNFEFGRRLEATKEGLEYVSEEGMRYAVPFLAQEGDSYEHPASHFMITRVSDTVYRLRAKDNRVFTFEWPALSSRAYLVSIGDLNGNEIRLDYDKRRQLIRIMDSARRRLVLDYTAEGRIRAVRLNGDGDKEADVTLVGYEYDRHGNLAAVIDAAGNVYRYTYDDHHWMTKKTGRNGYSFHYEYNSVGQCIKSRGDDGLYSGEIEYHPAARTTIFTVPNGSKHVYRHNDQNLVTAIIDPYGGVRNFDYDESGHLITEIDPNNNVRKLEYDERGNIVKETEFDGRKWKREWNELNLLVEETNPSGAKRQWKYDERGNLLEEMDALKRITTYEYNERGRKVKSTDPSGAVKRFAYDVSGLLTAIKDEFGQVLESFEYGTRGNVIRHRRSGQSTTFRHDALGRLLEAELPDGTRERQQFDAESNLLAREERDGQIWRYRYASWNRLVEETDPHGHITRYRYDNADELISVIDPGGTETRYDYDLNDRISKVHRHGELRESYRRDPAGNIVEKFGSLGQSLTSFEIGEGNRRAGGGPTSGPRSVSEYDPAGRLVFSERDRFRIEAKYDEVDREVERSWNGAFVKRNYDPNGRLAKLAYSEGFELSVKYSQTGAIATLTDSLGSMQELIGIGTQMRARRLPNGLIETKRFNGAGRLLELNVRRALQEDSTPLCRNTYRYDHRGNLVLFTDETRGVSASYGYDSLGRITAVARHEGAPRQIHYDAAGNALLDANSEIKSGNQLTRSGDVQYEYDGRGNVTRRSVGHQSVNLSYDGADNLVASESTSGVKTTYGYDGEDKRCWKQTGATRVEFHWSAHRLHRELRGENFSRVYVYLQDGDHAPSMFVDYIRESADQEWTAKFYYVHFDGNHTPVAITDEAGELVWTMEAVPLDESTVQDPHGLEFNLRFPGQYYDTETGLCCNGYRIYDPLTNRFLQSDPLGLKGGLNLYAYPANPLQLTDVLGLNKGGCGGEGKPTQREGEEDGSKGKPAGEQQPGHDLVQGPLPQDVSATLDRVAAGQRHPHRNDGSTFRNREGRLPAQQPGYYTEYVMPTPGVAHAGPQRVVTGRNGEVYVTRDHYGTFTRVR